MANLVRLQSVASVGLAEDPIDLSIIGTDADGLLKRTDPGDLRAGAEAAGAAAAVEPAREEGAAAGAAASAANVLLAEAAASDASFESYAASVSALNASLSATAAQTAGPIYATTTAGLAAVTEGATFSVAGSGATFSILYRKTDGAAVELGRYPSQAAVEAVPARTAPGPAATLARFVDRRGRIFAAIDQAGARLWAAGQKFTRETGGVPRWQRLDGTGAALDLRSDGITTDGERIGVGTHSVRSTTQDTQGGLTDWFRVVDGRKRGVIRIGLRHIVAGALRIISTAGGATTFSGPRGTLLSQGDTGGPIIPGRITEGSYPGAHLILKWMSGRVSAFRIDPADGALRLIGRNLTAVAGDFTGAELASFETEAADYGRAVVRRGVDLHQPTAGLVLWIIYGQSLAAGWEGWPRLTKAQPAPDLYMMGLSVHPASEGGAAWAPVGGSAALSPLTATVRDSSTGLLTDEQVEALTFGDNNRGETPGETWLAHLRRAWLRARGMPAGDPTNKWVLANCGVGGKSVAELSPGASPELYQRIRDAITAGQAQATALGVTFSVGGVLYNQGEHDYIPGTSYSDYVSRLTALFGAIRATATDATGQDGLLPIWMMQSGGQFARDALDLAIGRAQIEVARAVPGVWLCGGNQQYVDKGDHLSANGYRNMGGMIGRVSERTLINGEGYEPTRAIRWVARGRTIVGLFHAPAPPLRFAAPYAGFTPAAAVTDASRGIYITDDAGEVSISSVSIASSRLLLILAARALSGTPKVWLGRKDTFDGSVGVADSGDDVLFGRYEYEEGSGQTEAEDIAALVGLTYPSQVFALADVQTATLA